MFSPGTIKALGLVSKGVDISKAFQYAQQIDDEAAGDRINFYTQKSLSSFAAPATVVPSGASTIIGGQPSTVVSNSPGTTTMEDLGDLINSGKYKRNIHQSSNLNNFVEVTPPVPSTTSGSAQDTLITGSKRKVSTFYDSLLLPNTEDLQSQAFNPLNFTTVDQSLVKGKWGIVSLNDTVQAAADTITKKITKDTFPEETLNLDLSAQKEKAEIKKTVAASIHQLSQNFLKTEDPVESAKYRKLLDQEIDSKIKAIKDFIPDYTTSPGGFEPTAVTGPSSLVKTSEKRATQDAEIAKLQEIKEGIRATQSKKEHAKVGKQTLQKLQEGALSSTDLDKYLKSLDGFKNVAGGLSNLNQSFAEYLKKSNPDEYLDRPLTQKDIDQGGNAVINEMSLNRFLDKTPLSNSEYITEDRYDKTRGYIISTHVSAGEAISGQIQKENISLIKRQEELIKISNDPKVSADQLQKIQSEFKSIQRRIELNTKINEKVGEIHSYDAVKENKEIKDFAGAYLEEDAVLRNLGKRYFSEDIGAFEKSVWNATMTAQKLSGGTTDLVTGLLGGAASMLGLDNVATYYRRVGNYLRPRELMNFDVSNNKGNYQSASQFIFVDQFGRNHYRPSALLFTGAETAPLVIATVYGGSAITALGGRAIAGAQSTLLTRGLMSTKRAQQFNSILKSTNSYASAYRGALSQSNNALVKGLALRAPQQLALGTLIYPAEFGRTYEDLYRKGITNARAKAHAIAAVSTSIEMLTEVMFPDLKYLDDFTEKGLGVNKALSKLFGGKFAGSTNQYKVLYGDVFGKVFSDNTLNYLAVKAASAAGKAGSVGRFMLSRGVEEGIEEAAAEIMNYLADNHMGLAAMKGEPPSELEVADLVNAFTGALLGPPIGVGKQLKRHSQTKQYTQLFDIMLNGNYYKNKVNEGLKSGKITQENAAIVLSKIQELEAIEKEYGVTNLKNFQSVKAIETLGDLMEDPSLQFDYFKNVLEQRKITEALTKLESGTYTEAEKTALIEQAEQASARIDDYKQRSDFYSQMTDDDKKAVLDKNIANKVQLSKRTKTESIEKLEAELEEFTAATVANQRPAYFTESVRQYRDAIASLKQERQQAEEEATASGQYNPLVDHVSNESPQTSLTATTEVTELEDLMVQAILSPDKGSEIFSLINGGFDRQLEQLDKDSEDITAMYLAQLSANKTTDRKAKENADGTYEIQEGETDPAIDNVKVEDLTDAQQEELGELLAELNNSHTDIAERKQKISDILIKAINSVFPDEIAILPDGDARTAAESAWIENFYTNISDKLFAVEELLNGDPNYSQDVLYNSLRFDEYLSDNREKYEKSLEKSKSNRAAKAAETVAQEARENLPLEPDGTTETTAPVVVPELLPTDTTFEFTEALEELENTAKAIETLESNNSSEEVLRTAEINPRRGELLKVLFNEIFNSPTIESAKAKMAAVMQAAGETNEDIRFTLNRMDAIFNGEAVAEGTATHMFEMFDLETDFSTDFVKSLPLVETIEPTDTTELTDENVIPEQLSLEFSAPIETPIEAPVITVLPATPVTEEATAEVQSKNNRAFTTPLFYPLDKNPQDLANFRIQQRILENLFQNRMQNKPAIVDLFIIIEDVLGKETLDKWEAIYNELQSSELTAERKRQLRNEFFNLFPAGFIRHSALAYIFDTQMGEAKVSSRPVEASRKITDYPLTELGPLNHQREVTVTFAGMPVAVKGKFIYDSKNNVAKFVQGDGPDSVWNTLSLDKDKVEGLKVPESSSEQFTFNDLNIIALSTINAEGKVQSYNNQGIAVSKGTHAFISYLPTSKSKATPTPQESQYNALRNQVAKGTRVKKEVTLSGPVATDGVKRVEVEEGQFVDQPKSYTVAYNTDGLFNVNDNTAPSPEQVTNQKNELTSVTESRSGVEIPTVETNAQKVARYRAEEQTEIKAKFPNAEYKADGKIDVDALSVIDQINYGAIYMKYDKLITPLLQEQPATPTQPTDTKVSITAAKKMNASQNRYGITVKGDDVGFIVTTNPKNNVVQIKGVEIKEDLRGKGIAGDAYIKLGEELSNKGIALVSDNSDTMEPSAVRVWEKLVDKGYAEKTKDGYKFKAKQKSETKTTVDTKALEQIEADMEEELDNVNFNIEELELEGFDISEYINADKELSEFYKTIDGRNLTKTKKQTELESIRDKAVISTREKGNEWAKDKIRARYDALKDAELGALEQSTTTTQPVSSTKPFDVALIQENNPDLSQSNIDMAADVLSSQGIDIESLLGVRGLDDGINDPDITNPKDCG